MPLISWVTPANVSEGGLLVPSLQYCDQRWAWWPRQVVADMGYLAAESKRRCREQWRVAVLTHLRSDMKLVAPFVSEQAAACPQGERLQWLGYDVREDRHWFGVTPPGELCRVCWQASTCPREFAYAPAAHETLLGLLPLNTQPAQRLLQQVRPWIEPAQAYEKNQFGTGPDVSEQSPADVVYGFAGGRGRAAAGARAAARRGEGTGAVARTGTAASPTEF